MKSTFFRSSILALFVAIFGLFFVFSSAQAVEEGFTVNYDGEVVPYIPEVEVEIKETLFDEISRKFTVQADITNNTVNFLDDLEYVVEIRKGDSLAEEGYIFSTTEHTYQETKNLGKIAPEGVQSEMLSINIPENIESGNYFVQVFVNDKSLKFQNVDFTEEPIYLTGDGGRLSGVKMYFYTEMYGKTPPLTGLSTDLDQEPLVLIPLDENTGIDSYIEMGNGLFYEMEIYDTLSDKKLVYTEEGQFSRGSIDGSDSLFVVLSPDNSESLKQGGPFEIRISLINENGEELFERGLRWLIEYGQIIARIMSVESGRNFYRSGDRLEVSAEITSINGQGKEVVAELNLIGGWGFNQTFTKDILFDSPSKLISFDNEITERVKLKEINLTLKDKETGEVLDTYNMDIKYFRKYGVETYDTYFIIGGIIILAGLFIYLSRKNKSDILMLLVAIVLPAMMFFGGYNKAEAVCQCGGGAPTASFWVSKEPVTPVCGGDATMHVTLRVICGACVNGMQATINDSAGVTNVIDYGHEANPTIVHSVKQAITDNPTTMWARAKFTRNGCHCCPLPGIGDLCEGLPVLNGAMCPIDVFIGKLTRTVSCNLPGDCGSRNAQRAGNYSFEENSWPSGSGWCKQGDPSGTPTSFLNPGETAWWSCLPIPRGTGLGDTCSATRELAPNPDTRGCGDGIRQSGEECDDGNKQDGDGCSSRCLIEPGSNPGDPGDPGDPTDPGGPGIGPNPDCDDGVCRLGCSVNCPEGCGTDYVCGTGENANNCPQDCDPVCGNNACEQGEDGVCSEDCGGPEVGGDSVCGDGVCAGSENFLNCPDDCSSEIIEF